MQSLMPRACTRARLMGSLVISVGVAVCVIAGCSSATDETAAGTTGGARGSARALAATSPPSATRRTLDLPSVGDREFRGVFVTTAFNMDWPSRPELHWRAQRDEIDAIVNRVAELKCNVILLQVRSFGDRIHREPRKRFKEEPWAESLNRRKDPHGHPVKQYDPLAEWIYACHANGIELHVWVNPFRVDGLVETAPNQHLDVVPSPDGLYLTLSPRSMAVQNYLIDVIEELLDYKNKHLMPRAGAAPFGWPGQDGALASTAAASWMMLLQANEDGGPDGVVIDHNLPPGIPPTTLPSTGPSGAVPGAFEILAAAGAAGRISTGGLLLQASPDFITRKKDRIAWLANQQKPIPADPKTTNLTAFIHRVWDTCNRRQVKFGYSPLAGGSFMEAQWLTKGKLDYVVPELYMRLRTGNAADDQAFQDALKPWIDSNTFTNPADPGHKPYVVAGLHSNRVQSPASTSDEPWEATEITTEVDRARTVQGATTPQKAKGQAFYSWSALRTAAAGGPPDTNNLGQVLIAGAYAKRALLPPVRGASPLPAPTVNYDPTTGQGNWKLQGSEKDVRFWAVWRKIGNDWSEVKVYPKWKHTLGPVEAENASAIAVMAIDGFNQDNGIDRSPP